MIGSFENDVPSHRNLAEILLPSPVLFTTIYSDLKIPRVVYLMFT